MIRTGLGDGEIESYNVSILHRLIEAKLYIMTPTPNNNHMPLCWVHSAALQSHRKSYAYGRYIPAVRA